MTPETFRAGDLRSALAAVRRVYGEDAMILSTRGPEQAAGAYEVTVLSPVRGETGSLRPASRADQPYVIALVGPAGAGKSTAAAKLALRLRDEGNRVGLLNMDCFKIGALEQLQQLAELIDVSLDLLHDAAALEPVRARMAAYDTIIIDTPGRRSGPGDAAWAPLLAALAPDEVHLVLHAGLRPDVLSRAARAWNALAPDHVLPTHLDELPDDSELQGILQLLKLPARWIGTGAELLHPLWAVPLASSASAAQPALRSAEPVPEHVEVLDLMLSRFATVAP